MVLTNAVTAAELIVLPQCGSCRKLPGGSAAVAWLHSVVAGGSLLVERGPWSGEAVATPDAQ